MRVIVVLGVVLASMLCHPPAVFSQAPSDPAAAAMAGGTADPVGAAVQQLEQAAGGTAQVSRSRTTGLVTFFSASLPVALSLPATADPAVRATAFLAAHGRAFGIAGVGDVQHVRSLGPDEVGLEHARFRQLHGGVPVTGGELIVHLRGAGVVAVSARTLRLPERIITAPGVSDAEAVAIARALIDRRFGISNAVFSVPRLEVFNPGLLEARVAPTRLAWFVEARRLDLRQFIWIDAQTGVRLLDFSQLTDALTRSIYTADSGSTLPGTLVREEGDEPTGDADVNAAYDFSGDTYDYFLSQHDRDSYDGLGAPLISTVHYCPDEDDCPYGNAFWNGTQMVYGDGFSAADDVGAHELGHAVTEYTAGLFYYMQSGALNESYSDIFGETVDLLNGSGTDTAGVRWLLGEDIPGIGAIRNLMNPNAFDDPGKMSDGLQFNCQLPGRDSGGVHTNSGVPNHAYALMVDGGDYNGVTIAGIGLVKAGKIQYRALSTYLTSASDFLDNYHALKQSCHDLVGVAGITVADCAEVGTALDAVEMATPWPCSPPQASVPPFCPAGQIASNLFLDDLENTTSGNWAISTLAGATHWYYPAPPGAKFATSGVQNFWGYNEPVVGDSAIAMTTSVAIPAGGARLQFNQSYGFENDSQGTYDGGVVEYSTDGGASWSDAGGLIIAGATYGGTIHPSFDNPLAGRSAFVQGSFGYTASQLDLTGLAGQNVRFRFRIGTDGIFDDYGWFIDDVRLYRCLPGSPGQRRDFDGNGAGDVLWRHPSGALHTWLLDGTSIAGEGSPGGTDTSWAVQDVGDLNGDGKTDILWRHTSGLVYVWLMDGTRRVGAGSPGTAGPDWVVAGLRDFDGDGKADILWRHASGLVYVWLMDGTSRVGVGSPGSAGADWVIQGLGDLNGDGKGDILWRHTSGLVYVWLMDGTARVGAGSPGSAGIDWTIQGVADLDGDGRADVLWRHPSGAVFAWFLSGSSLVKGSSLGNVDPSWVIQGAFDFNVDGRADILWQHTSGLVFVWLMNGASVIGTGSPGSRDPTWVIQ